MKNRFLLFLVLFAGNLVFSQSEDWLNPTTLEEYNYLTKGYKIQIESGLDMKNGYVLKNFDNKFFHNISIYDKKQSRKVDFKLLYRDNEKRPCAALMILTRVETNYKEYLCIPSWNNELWKNFEKDFFKTVCNAEGMSEAESTRLVATSSYFFNSVKMLSYLMYYPEKIYK